jgi:hypothetical protein
MSTNNAQAVMVTTACTALTDRRLAAGREWPHFAGVMLYNPDRDLYELLGVSAVAGENEIRERLAQLRGAKDGAELEEAAAVLLNLRHRTQYDTQRATHRMRLLMRASLAVFSGHTPAEGVKTGWPPERAQ